MDGRGGGQSGRGIGDTRHGEGTPHQQAGLRAGPHAVVEKVVTWS